MLTRRTNVLLNELDYLILTRRAEAERKTMGELIRYAIRKTFMKGKVVKSTAQILKRIDELAKGVNTKRIDYKELINYGRKY